MSTFKISPPFALVTAGQAVTFRATDEQNQPVNVTWSLTPQLGSLVTASPAPPQQPPEAGQQAGPPQNQGSSSATYVAPSVVQTAQTVAVTATSATETGSTTISITPDAISVIPPAVELRAMQQQKFEVIVASGSSAAEPITWILTPQVGTLSDAGLYTAPDSVPDDETLTITAACKSLGKQVSANLTLKPGALAGRGRHTTRVLSLPSFLGGISHDRAVAERNTEYRCAEDKSGPGAIEPGQKHTGAPDGGDSEAIYID